jgi:hypothetical protein
MGYYISTGSILKNKAQVIAKAYNGTILPEAPKKYEDIPDGKALICVVPARRGFTTRMVPR